MISTKRIRAGIAVAALASATLFATVGGSESALAISPMHSPIRGGHKKTCVANTTLTIRRFPNESSRSRGTLTAGRRVKRSAVVGGWMKVPRGWVPMSGLTCS